jgi:Zn-dependent peptidase ImmA (M78 family)
MTSLRRGFKAEADALAREVRGELGLRLVDRFDAPRLAEHLGIDIVPITELAGSARKAVAFLTGEGAPTFSAVTVFDGPRRVIAHNDAHSAPRQNSNLSHELAHALLFHDPGPALDALGCRYWDPVLEAEANWQAGALLVTPEAAVMVVRHGLAVDQAAQLLGVSEQMLRWRINVTGARRRVGRMVRAS